MPVGRLITPADLRDLADRGLAGERVYLKGQFVVNFTEPNRAVLRPKTGLTDAVLKLAGGGQNLRVIVDFPAGYTRRPAARPSRAMKRALLITEVRKQSDGQLNVFRPRNHALSDTLARRACSSSSPLPLPPPLPATIRSPFQGLRFVLWPPRALPWAGMGEALGLWQMFAALHGGLPCMPTVTASSCITRSAPGQPPWRAHAITRSCPAPTSHGEPMQWRSACSQRPYQPAQGNALGVRQKESQALKGRPIASRPESVSRGVR